MQFVVRGGVAAPASRDAEKGAVGTPARSMPAELTASSCAGVGVGVGLSSGCTLGTSSLSMLNDFLPEQLQRRSQPDRLTVLSRHAQVAGKGRDARCAALYSSLMTECTWSRLCAGHA